MSDDGRAFLPFEILLDYLVHQALDQIPLLRQVDGFDVEVAHKKGCSLERSGVCDCGPAVHAVIHPKGVHRG